MLRPDRRLCGIIAAATGAGAGVGVLASARIDESGALPLSLAGAALLAGGLTVWAVARIGGRAVVVSPAAVALLLIVFHFTIRPLALIADRSTATPGLLLTVGFTWTDVARTASLGALVFGALVVAYAWTS